MLNRIQTLLQYYIFYIGFFLFSVYFKVFLVMLRYTEAILLYECWNKMGS